MNASYFAAAIEGAEDAIVTKSLDGTIQSWNAGASRLFGYAANEIVGQPINVLIPMDRIAEEREILRRLHRGERVEQYETVRLTKDGQRIAVSVAVSPIKDADGRVIGATKIARGAVAAPALPGHADLATMLDLLPVAVYTCDRTGAITAYNRCAAELWGRAPARNSDTERFCGSHRLFYADGRRMDPAQTPMAEALGTGQARGAQEIIVERPDGTRLFVLANPAPLRDDSGQVVGAINYLQDISDRRQQQHAQAHLAAIVELSDDAIISMSLDGIVRSWNQAAERIFGYRPQEMIGRPISILMPPEQQDEEAPILARVRQGECVERYETTRMAKGGRRVKVSLSISPIKDAQGDVIGVSEIARDIGERQEAERARAHLAAIIDSSLDAIISKSTDGFILSWNQSAERLFGYRAQEVIGRPISILIPPERRDEETRILERIRRGERVEHFETVRLTKNGKRLDLSLTISPIKDMQGRIIGASKIARDIGPSKRAAQAIERLNAELSSRIEELQTLLNVAPIGILVAQDPDFNDLRVNPAAARILGIGVDQNASLTGSERDKLGYRLIAKGRQISPEESPMRYAVRHNVSLEEVEIDVLRADGKTVNTLVYASPLRDDTGRVRGCLGVVIDVTERRQAECELLKTQRLESIGLLAGGIAHDFNNILTALFGNINLAQLAAAGDASVLEPLSQAENAFLRARDLTQQLLTFSRGGAPIRKMASIPELLTASVGFVLRGSNVRAEFDIAADLWPAPVDVGQINQALNNIVINAKEAMPGGGLLRVAAGNATLDEHNAFGLRAGDYIRIDVIDSGIGVAEEHLPRIFDPYFTTKERGVGLGLSTTYSIIKRHDGHITATSRPRVGTTFSFYLPASPQRQPEAGAPAADVATGRGRVLLMDDEAAVRKVTTALLAQLGYDAVPACDGTEACVLYEAALARGQRFDVVVLDMTVPGGMGGKECLTRLRELDPQVCALASSGYSNDPVMSHYGDHGFCGVIAKPYSLKELGEALNVGELAER